MKHSSEYWVSVIGAVVFDMIITLYPHWTVLTCRVVHMQSTLYH